MPAILVPPDRPRPPLLLMLWLGVSALNAVKLAIIAIGGLAVPGPYHISGAMVSKLEFALRALLPAAGGAVLLAAGVYGVWKQRAWARRVLVGTWLWSIPTALLLTMVGSTPAKRIEHVDPGLSIQLERASRGQASYILAIGAVGLLVSIWYLYVKPNVREYFARFESSDGVAPDRR